MPICQDTGLAVLFVEVGQDVRIIGGNLREALEEGVRLAYADGYLRKSICDPLTRKNTGDNTPAIIHMDIVTGNQIENHGHAQRWRQRKYERGPNAYPGIGKPKALCNLSSKR